jgi:hypothetical protein
MMDYLSTLPDNKVLNFLKSDQRVKELLSSDSIPPVKINVDSKTGDIVAIFCLLYFRFPLWYR